MTGNSNHQDYLGILRDTPVAVDSPVQLQRRRERVLPSFEDYVEDYAQQQIKARAVRRRRVAMFATPLLVAATIAFYFNQVGEHSSPTTASANTDVQVLGRLVSDTSGVPLNEALKLPETGYVRSLDDSATLRTNAGLELEFAPHTRVALNNINASDKNQELRVDRGRVTCSVPKKRAGTTFSVTTPDARVVVHGTVFSVDVFAGPQREPRTCVRVTEGLVAVHLSSGAPVMLHPGQAHGCDTQTAQVTAISVQQLPPEKPRRLQIQRPSPNPDLARATQLLQAAVASERTGDTDRAKRQLGQLIARYPRSALAAEARTFLKKLQQANTPP